MGQLENLIQPFLGKYKFSLAEKFLLSSEKYIVVLKESLVWLTGSPMGVEFRILIVVWGYRKSIRQQENSFQEKVELGIHLDECFLSKIVKIAVDQAIEGIS